MSSGTAVAIFTVCVVTLIVCLLVGVMGGFSGEITKRIGMILFAVTAWAIFGVVISAQHLPAGKPTQYEQCVRDGGAVTYHENGENECTRIPAVRAAQ